MKKIKVSTSSLKLGQTVHCDITTNDSFVVIKKGGVINQNLLNALERRGYPALYYDFGCFGDNKAEFVDFLTQVKNPNEVQSLQSEAFKRMEDLINTSNLIDVPIGSEFEKYICQVDRKDRSSVYKSNMEVLHNNLVEKIKMMFHGILYNGWQPAEECYQIVNQVLEVFVTDKNILLNLCNYEYKKELYLYPHVLNSCIMAMNIATSAKYSREQVIEIGVGALLHDLGMAYIDPHVLETKKALSPLQHYEIHKHPIISANFIDSIHNLPSIASIIAYQHQERENGKGYPKRRQGHNIHNFTKIVSVADVYMALIGDRPYRKGMRPYFAVRKLIELGQTGFLSMEVIRHLLSYLSLFPVGSIVQLDSQQYGQVIDSNPEDIAKPRISIIANEHGEVLSESRVEEENLIDSSLQIIGTKDKACFDISNMHGF